MKEIILLKDGEIVLKGLNRRTFEDVLKNIVERDRIDSTRVESPLKKAEDAIEIDTTGNTIEEVKEKILQEIEEYRNENLNQ